MPLNIKDPVTEQLARDVAAMTGESKTGAIRSALRERRERLLLAGRSIDTSGSLPQWLEDEVWSVLPPGSRGKAPSREEQEALLGGVEPAP